VGYYSTITGAITIAPPLTWTEYKDSGFAPGPRNLAAVALRTHEEPRDGEGGVMFVRWADGIVPATDERIRAYDLDDEVQAIVDAYRSGHTFSGYLEIVGDEQGDLWRLYVWNGRAIRVEPTITWPAGEDA